MADHVVYRVYDAAGQLLYVGMSSTFASRLGQHQAGAEWWAQAAQVEKHLPSRWHTYQRESELIRQLRPPYNQRLDAAAADDNNGDAGETKSSPAEPARERNRKSCSGSPAPRPGGR